MDTYPFSHAGEQPDGPFTALAEPYPATETEVVQSYDVHIIPDVAPGEVTPAQGIAGEHHTLYAELVAARQRIYVLEQENTALLQEVSDLRLLTETDQLTADGTLRIGNRAALDQALPRAEADLNTLVLSFDGNNFGKINKILEYGPETGDQELRNIVRAIRIACAHYGVGSRSIFRRGGDEFVAFVPVGSTEYTEYDLHGRPAKEFGTIPIAEAVIRRADTLYGTRRFEGAYGDQGERLVAEVSISGTYGQTFHAADAQLQAVKMARKSHPSVG